MAKAGIPVCRAEYEWAIIDKHMLAVQYVSAYHDVLFNNDDHVLSIIVKQKSPEDTGKRYITKIGML